jgi:hypothetical protein
VSRTIIGVSKELHQRIKDLSTEVSLPMTIILEHLMDDADKRDWSIIRKSYDASKPTWANIKSSVEEYRKKHPNSTDQHIVDHTGYSIAQVETITHTAHKRCIAILKTKGGSDLHEKANVSKRFARRMIECYKGDRKPPKTEEYLYEQG